MFVILASLCALFATLAASIYQINRRLRDRNTELTADYITLHNSRARLYALINIIDTDHAELLQIMERHKDRLQRELCTCSSGYVCQRCKDSLSLHIQLMKRRGAAC